MKYSFGIPILRFFLIVIQVVINMFRFHDAIEPRFHIAGLPFPGGKRQTRNVGRKESEHIYDMGYITISVPNGFLKTLKDR